MEQAVEFTEVLVGAGEQIAQALRCLRTGTELAPHLVEIHRLENEGDRLQRDGVASLFAGGIDPMVVIRWKDIFESLEAAVDACETVAHVLEGITLKQRRRRRCRRELFEASSRGGARLRSLRARRRRRRGTAGSGAEAPAATSGSTARPAATILPPRRASRVHDEVLLGDAGAVARPSLRRARAAFFARVDAPDCDLRGRPDSVGASPTRALDRRRPARWPAPGRRPRSTSPCAGSEASDVSPASRPGLLFWNSVLSPRVLDGDRDRQRRAACGREMLRSVTTAAAPSELVQQRGRRSPPRGCCGG